MIQGIVSDRYQIRNEIGSGSVGTVYYAIDLQTQKPVAVKLLRPEIIANDPNILKRFKHLTCLHKVQFTQKSPWT